MVSFIGTLTAMVSMALAVCSLALAVVVYRRAQGSDASRQEPVQRQPTAVVGMSAVVTAGSSAVDDATGRPIIARWFSRSAVPFDVWLIHLLIASWSCVAGEQLSSGLRAAVCGCRMGCCRGLSMMRRLVRLWPLVLVVAWAGQRLAPCWVVGRGPPARNAHFLSLIAAAITPPINQKTGG